MRSGRSLLAWVLAFLLTSLTAQAQTLSGTYTINSAAPTAGTNFASFTAAAAALNTRGRERPGVAERERRPLHRTVDTEPVYGYLGGQPRYY